jgi:type III secretion translocon protein HrpF
MNMPLQRTTESPAFVETAALVQSPGGQPGDTPIRALPTSLSNAVWAVSLYALKATGQATGEKSKQSCRSGGESALTKQSANPSAGAAQQKPQPGMKGVSALTQQDAAEPVNVICAKGKADCADAGFDFQQFMELVRQLINSCCSSSGALSGAGDEQSEQEALPGQGQARRVSADPAVEQKRMEIIAVLGRHEDKFKKAVDDKGLDKLIADEKTPPDLVRALKDMKADPQMMEALDKAKNGKKDLKFSAEDINALQANSANKAFAEQKAEDFEQTYVPSDCKDPNAKPRPITNNDAKRELFRYSDHLPKDVSRENLQKIVDGTSEQGKAPPQLVAAAKFYVDNPAAWEKDTGKGPDESIRKDGLCNEFAKSMELTAEEDKTLKVLDENRETFFGGSNLNDAKLKQIAGDPAAKPEVRDAAKALQEKKGSVLYAMLDNGKHGHGGNVLNAANDRRISGEDLDRVMAQRNKSIAPPVETATPLSEKVAAGGTPGKTAQAAKATDPSAARASQAAQDMSDGQQDQPDAKKKQGGQLRDIATFFLKVYSTMMNVTSNVLGLLVKVPGLGWIAGFGAMAASGLSGSASTAVAELEGKDTKKAAAMAGVGMAATFVGFFLPGGAKLVKESAKVTAKEGGKAGADEAAKTGAREGGKAWGQREIVNGTAIRNDVVAKEAGWAAAGSLRNSALTNTAEETGLTDAASGFATNEYHAYELSQEEQRRAAEQQEPPAA